jgi:hypothetical protein
MMQELVKYVGQLEKKLISCGESQESIDKLKEKLEKEYKVKKLRENPRHLGQDFIYYYDALREYYINLLKTKYNLKKDEILGEK